MGYTTVIIAHRNRWKHLTLCLQALDIAARGHDVEIVLADQSDEMPPDPIYSGSIPVHLLRSTFQAPYWKSQQLNAAVEIAKGDLLTFLDVDCVCPPNFFARINEIHQQNPDAKIGHTVRLMDKQSTRSIAANIQMQTLPRPSRFNAHSNEYRGHAVGSGIFTIRKDQFLDLGGYSTAYRGWGLEDLDFNLRAEKHGIQTLLPTDIDLLHMFHDRTPDWHNPECEMANRRLFLATWGGL